MQTITGHKYTYCRYMLSMFSITQLVEQIICAQAGLNKMSKSHEMRTRRFYKY